MEGRLRRFGHTSKKDEIRIKGNRKRGELWKKLMKVIQGKTKARGVNEVIWLRIRRGKIRIVDRNCVG